jgi:hypothetical protein
MNLEKIISERLWSMFRVLSQGLLEVTEDSQEKFSQDSQPPYRKSNSEPRK